MLAASCGSRDSRDSGDECDRAAARLERLDARHHRAHPAWMDEQVRTQCREHGWDPVVNCAIVAPTDDAADACIERGIRATLGIDGDAQLAPHGDGKGLDPLSHGDVWSD